MKECQALTVRHTMSLAAIDNELASLDLSPDQRATILADVRAKADAAARLTQQSLRETNVALARRVHSTRLKGNRLLGARIMCDPNFEMLLDLFVADYEGRQVSVSDLCLSADAPQTTGLRHIARLESAGYLRRTADRRDGRRCWIEPTERTIEGMGAYMTELGRKS